MGTTSHRELPYPEGYDDPAVPADIQELADALDDFAKFTAGTLAAIPASGEKRGDLYWAFDGGEDTNGGLYAHNGISWTLVGPKTIVVTADIQDNAVTQSKMDDDSVGTAEIINGNVTGAKLNDDVKPSGTAVPGDESLRAIGSTGDTVIAGNDTRLTAGAAGSETVRALGTSSTEAMAGDDVRATSPFAAIRRAARGVEVGDIDTSSAPATLDGISPTAGDRFLLVGQTSGDENGIWIWNGAAAAMTRSTDFNSSAFLNTGIIVFVWDGVDGITKGTTWALTNTGTITIDVTALDFKAINYQGYGATGSKPDATLVFPGGQYLDTSTRGVSYSNGSAWSDFQPVPAGTMLPFVGGTVPDGYLFGYGQVVSQTTYAGIWDAQDNLHRFGADPGGGNFYMVDTRGRSIAGLDNLGGVSANRLTSAWADTIGGVGGGETATVSIPQLPTGTIGTAGSSGSAHVHTVGAHSHPTFNSTVRRRNALISANHAGHTSSDGSFAKPTGNDGTVYAPNTGSNGNFSTGSPAGTGQGAHSHSVSSAGSGLGHSNVQPTIALGWLVKT